MFVKRDDGLGMALLPFDIGAIVLAALCTAKCGERGWLVAPVFLGWWLLGFAALFLAYYFVIWLVSLTVDMKKPAEERDHPFHRLVVLYALAHICRFGRVRIHLSGAEKLPAGRFLIVSNHRSAYDPIITVWALRKTPCVFITKPENHRIPIAGPMIYQANYLPIDRDDPRRAMETINAAARLLKNDVTSVGVYPEGTRGHETGMLPFHNGVFKIAQKAGVPIVVAAISGSERIRGNFPRRHTDVSLRVCSVIPPEELRVSTAEIGARVRESLERALGLEPALC